jgi:hypothetical protein
VEEVGNPIAGLTEQIISIPDENQF